MAEHRVLLELDVDGEIHGFAIDNESVLVELDDGTERVFGPGVTIEDLPARSAPIFGVGVAEGSVRVLLQLPALDLWTRRDRVQPQQVIGRLYFWPEGEVLRPEHEIYRGALRSPDWALAVDDAGNQVGSVTFDLAPPTRTADVAFPPAAVGDDGRFPDAPEGSAGQAVPVIYGTVRGVQLVPISDTAGDPVRLLVAGHAVVSASVTVRNGEGTAIAGGPYTVSMGTDGRGDVYSYVEVDAANYVDNLHAAQVTGWARPDGEALDRLGDVLLHLWTTYGGERFYELDRDRVFAARVRLNRFGIAAFFNERSDTGTVLRAIAGRIEPQFPVVFGFACGRFGWDATDLPEGDADPARVLTYGVDSSDRVGPSETSVDDVLTEFEIAYAYDGFEGGTTASKQADRDNNGACRGAESRWGRSAVSRFSAPDVADDDTAALLLADQVRRRTEVRLRVSYLGLDGTWTAVRLWEQVAVTDAECGWSEKAFIVEGRKPRLDGRVDLTLVEKDGA